MMANMSWALTAIFTILLCLLVWQKIRGKQIPVFALVMLGLFTISFGMVANFVNRGEDYTAWQRLQWQELQPQQIDAMVAAGKTVVIDVTADWCFACRKNTVEVLRREPVVEMLEADHMVLMLADMTKPHPVAEQYLTQRGIASVPFNIIFSPAHPEGMMMPPELTFHEYIAALKANSPG